LGAPVAPARLWWALSYYGHDRVQVLDGGLRKWRAEGRPLSTEVPAPPATVFTARPRANWIATKQDVAGALGQPGVVIVDCLSPDMYGGTENHPGGERPGHIPGAGNAPTPANIYPTRLLAPSADYQRVWGSSQGLTYASRDAPSPSYTSRRACHHTSRSSRTVDGDTVRPADYWPSRRWGTNGSGSTTDLGQNGVPILTCPSRSLPHRPVSRGQSRSLLPDSDGTLRVISVLTANGPATPNKRLTRRATSLGCSSVGCARVNGRVRRR